MASPSMGEATSTTALEVVVTELASGEAAGGATIDSYHLEWDQGTGAWTDLVGEDGAYQLATSHTVPGVAGGNAYRFRARAHNVHGWGPASAEAVIYATSAPAQPDPVTTAQVNENIEIQWAAPLNNYESLDAYRVAVQSSSGTFVEDLTNCDASAPDIMDELRCRVPVAVLVAAPFSLPPGATVVAKVQARNARGWGPFSAENTAGALVITVPLAMAAPVRDSAATTTAQIKVSWTALVAPANGMSDVLTYNLEWDAGSDGAAWAEVVGETTDYLLTHFTVSSGLTPGTSYRFRVRARNALGWGAQSPEASVKAATRPSQVAPVTTELDPATGGVKVTLAAPYDNAQPITAYRVEVAHGASWSEEPGSCDGSSAAFTSSLSCIIPMSALRAAPFSLTYGDVVQVRAQAENAYGWGDLSDPAGSLTVRTEPGVVATPVREASTTASLLRLSWTALVTAVETGGAAITSYNVQWDAGTAGASWTHLQGYGGPSTLTTIDITSGITPGQAYQVRVRAANVYGYGSYSTPATIYAAEEPGQVGQASLASAVSGLNVALTWTAPSANQDPLLAYRILIREADGDYSEEATHCDGGTDASILSGATCSVPMTVLRAAPYSLAQGDPVLFTVAARNSYGWGLTSQLNTATVALVETEPHTPPAPSYVAASSSLATITLSWPGIAAASAATGGSPIVSYGLQWREAGGSDPWVDLQGQAGAHTTALTGSATTGVAGGQTYLFRLAAANAHGWSGHTAELTVVASGAPDQPSAPTTSLDSLTVRITWAAPGDNYGGILAYKVAVVDSGGAPSEESTYCDGASAPILADRYCQVPMTHLRASYGLARGDLVEAQVQALGRNGWSAWSALNTAGVTVQTEPGAMAPPTEGALTSEA
jgi:hypothetical protein